MALTGMPCAASAADSALLSEALVARLADRASSVKVASVEEEVEGLPFDKSCTDTSKFTIVPCDQLADSVMVTTTLHHAAPHGRPSTEATASWKALALNAESGTPSASVSP